MRTWTLNFLIWWFKLLTNTDAYLKIICILRPSTSSLNLFRAINSTIIYGPIRFLTDSSGHEVLVKIFVLERIFQYWNSGHFVKYLESQRFAARFQSFKGLNTTNPNQENFWNTLKPRFLYSRILFLFSCSVWHTTETKSSFENDDLHWSSVTFRATGWWARKPVTFRRFASSEV